MLQIYENFCIFASEIPIKKVIMLKRRLLLSVAILMMALLKSTWLNAQTQAPMVLQYNRPADYFEESLPIGNGKLGALVYGGTDDNIIYLNDITMWTGKPVDRNLDKDAHRGLSDSRLPAVACARSQ